MTNSSPLISVIVPVYNVREYLPRCIESILAQTHTNIEVLLVDDGSTDGGGEICDKYATKDSRVRVTHKVNAGVAAARNTGLDAARGEFVGFIDSDDWIEPDMYSELLKTLLSGGKETAACFAAEAPKDTLISGVFSHMEALEHVVRGKYLDGVVWSLLIRRDMIERDNPIRFDEDLFGADDRLFATRIFLRADGVSYVNKGLYHFITRQGSITRSFGEKRLDVLKSRERIVALVTPVSDKLARIARFNAMDTAVYLINRSVRFKKPEFLPKLKKAARGYAFEYFTAKELSIPKKLRNAAVTFFPGITNWLWSIAQKRLDLKSFKKRLNKK